MTIYNATYEEAVRIRDKYSDIVKISACGLSPTYTTTCTVVGDIPIRKVEAVTFDASRFKSGDIVVIPKEVRDILQKLYPHLVFASPGAELWDEDGCFMAYDGLIV